MTSAGRRHERFVGTAFGTNRALMLCHYVDQEIAIMTADPEERVVNELEKIAMLIR
jgi:hypothetical protein